MFSDGKDTFIYNTGTGEVFIRVKREGPNYKDVFVRMPRGLLPTEMDKIKSGEDLLPLTPASTDAQNKKEQRKIQDDALELQKKMLQSVIQ